MSNQTYEVIMNRLLTNENTKKTGLATNEGAFLHDIYSAKAVDEAKLYLEMDNLFSLAFIEDSFDEYLDRRINEFGVYRKLGLFASGHIEITADAGTRIPAGTVLTVNNLEYITVEEAIIEDVPKTVLVEARGDGVKYNLNIGAELEMVDASIRIKSAVVLDGFDNGRDTESDEDFKARFYDTQGNNATSGNVAHYVQWAKEVNGVYNVKVTPLHAGPGTVKVAISGKGNQPCGEKVIQDCINHIEQVRPIGATVSVVTTALMNIHISATIELKNESEKETIKTELEELINEYLQNSANEVTFSKIYSIIASHEAVNDCSNVLINDSNKNIKINDAQVPVLETLTLNFEEVI